MAPPLRPLLLSWLLPPSPAGDVVEVGVEVVVGVLKVMVAVMVGSFTPSQRFSASAL